MRFDELGAVQHAFEVRFGAQAGRVAEIAEQIAQQQTQLESLAAASQAHSVRERQLSERIAVIEVQTFGAFVNRVWSGVRHTGRRLVVGATATLARVRRKEVL